MEIPFKTEKGRTFSQNSVNFGGPPSVAAIYAADTYTQGANHHIFVKTDMVCYKRLLYMVGFLRLPATTSGWTTFSIGYCNSEIQDGVQDGRRNLKSPYYQRLLLYFHAQYIVSMVFEVRESIYGGFRVI